MTISVNSKKKQVKKTYEELIIDLTTSTSEKTRYNAARILGEMGESRAVEPLIDVLKNDKNVLTLLKGNGDFRSEECVDLLKECDVVVTNPPFSLFRQYMALLLKYDKKFLIIGNQNAISYKEIFPLIQQNKLWLGQSIHSGDREFRVPDTYPLKASGYRVDENGVKYIRVKGIRWFTNLDNMNRHEEFIPYKNYDPIVNERYDNYDAINVDVSADIPCDYDGLMGVPITFLDKYNPDQFEIVGILKSPLGNHLRTKVYPKQIQHKVGETKTAEVSKLNDGPAIRVSTPPTKKDDVYYTIGDEIYVSRYARLLIRRK